MKSYEYKTVLIAPALTINNEKMANSYNEQITAHSSGGWRLSGIMPFHNKIIMCVFEREIN